MSKKSSKNMTIFWLSIFLLLFITPISHQSEDTSLKQDVQLKTDLTAIQNQTNSCLTHSISSSTALIEKNKAGMVKTAYSSQTKRKLKRRKRTCKEFKNFIGSNLFDGDRKKCFSPEDVNVLAARREFELAMIPKDMRPKLLTDKCISVIMRFFSFGHLHIRRLQDCSTSRVLKRAFFDTFGAFMHYFLLPVVKMSYYAGDVKFRTVSKVIDYYEKCRFFLNTNGNGWRSPLHFSMDRLQNLPHLEKAFKKASCDIEPSRDYCCGLDLIRPVGNNEIIDDTMLVPLPKIELEDSEGFLGNIWLPYTGKSTYSFRASSSAFIIVNFYKKVTECYTQRQVLQDAYDSKFRQWIAENILPHLYDEEFYPSLGGVIGLYRYLESLERRCKEKCAEVMVKLSEDESVLDKRELNTDSNVVKQRRKTSKYMDLETKTKQMTSGAQCDLNWLRNINALPPEIDEKCGKTIEKSKWMKLKSKFKLPKWLSWLKGSCESSEKGSGWKMFRKFLKYAILLLILLIALCILCKLISLLLTFVCGVGGSIGGDCFGILWNLIFEFLKKLVQVLAVLFTCSCRTLFKKTQRKPPQPPPRAKNITAAPTKVSTQNEAPKKEKKETPKKSKLKKPTKTASKQSIRTDIPISSKSSKTAIPAVTPTKSAKEEIQVGERKPEVSFSEQTEEIPRRSRQGRKRSPQGANRKKRLRGGQNYVRVEVSTDSSQNSKEKRSWQTFYDF